MREVRPGVWRLTLTTATGDRASRTITGNHAKATQQLARLATAHRHAATTLDALVTVYLAHMSEAGRSATTLRRYEQLWRTWLASTLGAIDLNDLRRADVEHALDHMHEAGQSDRSIHQAAVVLNTTLTWAREQHIVEVNPVTGCELPNGTTLTATRRR